jgi:hypothetical protein
MLGGSRSREDAVADQTAAQVASEGDEDLADLVVDGGSHCTTAFVTWEHLGF